MKKNDRRKRKLQEEACDYEIERTPTTRYEPDYEEGLTSAQAEEHRRDGGATYQSILRRRQRKRSLRKMYLHILI
mgnify:CR=1 FL=1